MYNNVSHENANTVLTTSNWVVCHAFSNSKLNILSCIDWKWLRFAVMFSRVLMKLEDISSRKGSFTVTLHFIYFFSKRNLGPLSSQWNIYSAKTHWYFRLSSDKIFSSDFQLFFTVRFERNVNLLHNVGFKSSFYQVILVQIRTLGTGCSVAPQLQLFHTTNQWIVNWPSQLK